MNAEQQFFQALAAAPAVVGLVGARVYPDVAQQDAPLPLVIFLRTNTEVVTTIHDGLPVATKATITAICYALSQLAADHVADQMVVAMRTAGVLTNRLSQYDEETATHATAVDFDIWDV